MQYPRGVGEHTNAVITLERLLQSFKWELDRHPDSTQRNYLGACKAFLRFLDAHNIPADTDVQHKPDIIREFLAERGDQWKPNTVRRDYKGLKAFWRWAKKERGNGVDVDPMDNVRAPIVPDPEPVRVLTDDEVRALLATCKRGGFVDVRDEAIIRLLYDTGMRRSEVIAMTTGDIDWNEREVKVIGKGRRPRRATISPSTRKALDAYDLRRPEVGTDAFWLGRDERTPLARDGIAGILERRSERAKIGHVHPHMLRHTAISNLLASDMSEGEVCEMTGTSREQLDATYAKWTRSRRARDSARKLALGDNL
jgi:integrase/recombinase XerC